jgi:hypothetical protein
VPVTTKVAAFEREIGGDEKLVVGWGLQDGAVVADAQADGWGGRGAGADAFDEEKLADGFSRYARVRGVRHRFQSKSSGRGAGMGRICGLEPFRRLLWALPSIKIKGRSSGNCAELSQGLLPMPIIESREKSGHGYGLALDEEYRFNEQGKRAGWRIRILGREKHCGSALSFM